MNFAAILLRTGALFVALFHLLACASTSGVAPEAAPAQMLSSAGTIAWRPPQGWRLSEYGPETKGLWRAESAPQGWISIQERDVNLYLDPRQGTPVRDLSSMEIAEWEKRNNEAAFSPPKSSAQFEALSVTARRMGIFDGACLDFRLLEISGNQFRRKTCGFVFGSTYFRFSYSAEEPKFFAAGAAAFEGMLNTMQLVAQN